MSAFSLRFAVRNLLGRSPALFYAVCGIRLRNRQQSVHRNTQLVIEGFPRSANTYTVIAFRYAQSAKVQIASHLHVPAQIIRAVRLKIPSLVLIRKPKDAVASLLVRSPSIPACQALRAYANFYKTLLPYEEAYVVATFEAATRFLDRVIETVNERFHTEFAIPALDAWDVREIFKLIDEANWRADGGLETHLARPSPRRNAAKRLALNRIESLKNRQALAEAETIFHEFVSSISVSEDIRRQA